jgi:3-isopropylmalate dehydrogenase
MMLTVLSETDAGDAVEDAVAKIAGSLPSLQAGRMGASTSDVGNRVAELVSAGRSAEIAR